MSCFLVPSTPYRGLMGNLNHNKNLTMETISKNSRISSNMANKTVAVNKQESAKYEFKNKTLTLL